MADAGSWTIAGTYLEACNCEAICPCRRVGGRSGGRSTYGVCTGALSWAVTSGHADDVRLDGLGAVIACQYDDDEPGSPWTFRLFVNERGDDDQRRALMEILTGTRGGSVMKHFPWAWKESRFLGWQPAAITIDHTPGRGWFRAAGSRRGARAGARARPGAGGLCDPRVLAARDGGRRGRAARHGRALRGGTRGALRIRVNVPVLLSGGVTPSRSPPSSRSPSPRGS